MKRKGKKNRAYFLWMNMKMKMIPYMITQKKRYNQIFKSVNGHVNECRLGNC